MHDVIASLSVSEQLDPLDQARRVPHDGVVRGIVVHEAEGHLDRVESSQSPPVSGILASLLLLVGVKVLNWTSFRAMT